MIKANDPSLKSWIDIPEGSDFSIQNLPFGVYKRGNNQHCAASAIGDFIIDLDVLHQLGFFSGVDLPVGIFTKGSLNDFISLGKSTTGKVRGRLSELFDKDNLELQGNKEAISEIISPRHTARMLMPVQIGDYTDFYSSEQHAYNVGCMFRDPDNALLPNWKHIPVGYHGRASSIVVSGTPIYRPKGQMNAENNGTPFFGPTKRLDFELEMAFITGKSTILGDSISVAETEDYIFGMVLFNDWSARDVQKWEYVPLGPFLAKNFGSVISPWIVTMDALEPFRVKGPKQDPPVLPYLKSEGDRNFDIHLEVDIQPERSEALTVSRSNFKYMYWDIRQQLAHHTVNGCNINVGDLYASGTISGPTPQSYGSMLELAWKGTKPLKMTDGSERRFIHDGDTVTMRGYAKGNNVRVGFGEVSNKILPSK